MVFLRSSAFKKKKIVESPGPNNFASETGTIALSLIFVHSAIVVIRAQQLHPHLSCHFSAAETGTIALSSTLARPCFGLFELTSLGSSLSFLLSCFVAPETGTIAFSIGRFVSARDFFLDSSSLYYRSRFCFSLSDEP